MDQALNYLYPPLKSNDPTYILSPWLNKVLAVQNVITSILNLKCSEQLLSSAEHVARRYVMLTTLSNYVHTLFQFV